MTPKPDQVCPDCGLPGSHITSADCIRALKAALKQLQEAGRS